MYHLDLYRIKIRRCGVIANETTGNPTVFNDEKNCIVSYQLPINEKYETISVATKIDF